MNRDFWCLINYLTLVCCLCIHYRNGSVFLSRRDGGGFTRRHGTGRGQRRRSGLVHSLAYLAGHGRGSSRRATLGHTGKRGRTTGAAGATRRGTNPRQRGYGVRRLAWRGDLVVLVRGILRHGLYVAGGW